MTAVVADDSKQCRTCNETKPAEEFSPQRRVCRACIRERHKHWREANPEKLQETRRRERQKNAARRREADRLYRQANPEKLAARARRNRQANPSVHRSALRRYRAKLKTAVFDHYGWQCTCCGRDSNPTIDHVFGGGTEHRTKFFGMPDGGRSLQLYRWLIDNGFPAGFQTLCQRCNSSKGTGNACRIAHRIAGVNQCTS